MHCHVYAPSTGKHQTGVSLGLHLVGSFSRVLRTAGGLLQQVGDDVVGDVKELLVDLLVLAEIVISWKSGNR